MLNIQEKESWIFDTTASIWTSCNKYAVETSAENHFVGSRVQHQYNIWTFFSGVALSCRKKRMLSVQEKEFWVFSTTITIWTSYYRYPIDYKSYFWNRWTFLTFPYSSSISNVSTILKKIKLYKEWIESQCTKCPCGHLIFTMGSFQFSVLN